MYMSRILNTEAALQRCSHEKAFWKYAANLLENTHAEMRFQCICFATLLKLHFGMDVLLKFVLYFQNTFS